MTAKSVFSRRLFSSSAHVSFPVHTQFTLRVLIVLMPWKTRGGCRGQPPPLVNCGPQRLLQSRSAQRRVRPLAIVELQTLPDHPLGLEAVAVHLDSLEHSRVRSVGCERLALHALDQLGLQAPRRPSSCSAWNGPSLCR